MFVGAGDIGAGGGNDGDMFGDKKEAAQARCMSACKVVEGS
jgi:hypothetical protein